MKTNSVFKNIVSGSLTETTTFWDFAFLHLTGHEKERFSSLRYGNYSRLQSFEYALENQVYDGFVNILSFLHSFD